MSQPKLSKLSLWGEAKAYAEGRAYRDPRDGKKYPSVTTILKLVNKELGQWASDMCARWCADNWQLLGERSDEQAFNTARYRWKDVRDERAEVGTGVHETVEALHTGSWVFPELDEEQLLIMEQWELLNQEHRIEPILSEFTVFDTVKGRAGTADGYWRITCLHDGPTCLGQEPGVAVLTLVDVKTSKNMWPEHCYQLAALWEAPEWVLEVEDMVWRAEPRRQIDAVAIIHLRADKREIVPVHALDLNARIFDAYASAWYAVDALKTWNKEQEKLALGNGFAEPVVLEEAA